MYIEKSELEYMNRKRCRELKYDKHAINTLSM